MRTITAVRAAGWSDPGLLRDVNEDRYYCDPARGLFAVVDGLGGQAAGGRAADIALSMLRTRLERETGPTGERVREAITIANNEILRTASLRPEWTGMACVLTVAVVEDGHAVVGHVGDTRLYKLGEDRIEKITRDHSPVGEREDASEISERVAMHHPRRHEVYRDVGSEAHEPADPDFIDLFEIPFDADEALLICSDGLTDVVESTSINDIVRRLGGQPEHVVHALVDAANAAGGKDNVTVVYVEGEQFAPRRGLAAQPVPVQRAERKNDARQATPRVPRVNRDQVTRIALVALLTVLTVLVVSRWRPSWLDPSRLSPLSPNLSTTGAVVVQPSDSIAAAVERAAPGSTILVEPGEYRERIVLRNGVRLVSRVPRGATIRLPGTASERDPAVVATGISGAELAGFRIIGDAATPLGTGLLVKDAELSVTDIEVTGAATVAIDLDDQGGAARVSVLSSDIHDNPGSALAIRGGAAPRIAHNVFLRNGLSERSPAAVDVERWQPGAEPQFSGNVFHGMTPKVFDGLSDDARAALVRDNWFPGREDGHDGRPPAAATPRGRQNGK